MGLDPLGKDVIGGIIVEHVSAGSMLGMDADMMCGLSSDLLCSVLKVGA